MTELVVARLWRQDQEDFLVALVKTSKKFGGIEVVSTLYTLLYTAYNYNPFKMRSLGCLSLRLHFLQLSSRPGQIFNMRSKSEWCNVKLSFSVR